MSTQKKRGLACYGMLTKAGFILVCRHIQFLLIFSFDGSDLHVASL